MSDARDSKKTSVTVLIAGEEHTIRARAEPDHTRRCARFVDERISEIRSKSGRIETHKAAILAALSITDELFQARAQGERSGQDVAERTQALAARLNEALSGTDEPA